MTPQAATDTPRLIDFEATLGELLAKGDWPAAEVQAARCRAAFPRQRAGWLLGSIAALLKGDAATALALVDERLAVDPGDLSCRVQQAECLLACGRPVEAIAAADAALMSAAAQRLPAALDALGELFVRAADHQRALRAYDDAIAASSADVSLLAKRAVIHRFLGNFAAAQQDHTAVLRHTPNDGEALKGLAELRRQTPVDGTVAAMESALEAALTAATDTAQVSALHFGLAKAYEDLGEHAANWRHLTAGNRLERARILYESAQDRAVMEGIARIFAAPEGAWPDTTGARPVFIVGLPRTGTTLVERILGNHPQVHSAGELPALSEAIGIAAHRTMPGQRLSWMDYVDALGHTDAALIAREYLAHAAARRGSRPRFSDKQPVNFFYCALIQRAFPGAHIVHLRRHPLAACYAIYKTRFGGTYPFAYDLAELGEFYVGYHRLMEHWQRVMPGRIYDVRYEDIVTALEPTTRALLAHLELPFEAACLDFHLNPASTATASSVQVRQPLYSSSLDHWRHHAAELAPLRAQLADAGIAVD